MITERLYCDFILYAEDGPVAVERIVQDMSVMQDILRNLTTFWSRAIAPEVFEMRVPRDLVPFKLSSVMMKTVAPTEPHPPVMSTVAPTGPHSTGTTSASPYKPLTMIPWGGTTSDGIHLANTCPLDNWLMILQVLVNLGKLDLDNLGHLGMLLKTTLYLIEQHLYADAKLYVLPKPPVIRAGVIDLYGNEADYMQHYFQSFLKTEVATFCDQSSCPSPMIIHNTYSTVLSIPANRCKSFVNETSSHSQIQRERNNRHKWKLIYFISL